MLDPDYRMILKQLPDGSYSAYCPGVKGGLRAHGGTRWKAIENLRVLIGRRRVNTATTIPACVSDTDIKIR